MKCKFKHMYFLKITKNHNFTESSQYFLKNLFHLISVRSSMNKKCKPPLIKENW